MPKSLPTTMNSPIIELIPFSKIKLIVADLDGTLLELDGKLWEDICTMLRRIGRYRVLFTIATGRTYAGSESLIKKLRLSRKTPMVLYNGAIIAKPSKKEYIKKNIIPSDTLKQIINICQILPINLLAYYWTTESEKFFNPGNILDIGETVLGWSNNSSRPITEFNGQIINWQILSNNLVSSSPCTILIDMDNCKNHMETLERELNGIDTISITKSGGRYLEIRPRESNKWKAINFIIEQLGIMPNQVLALGDNENDIEMMASSGIGVAVHNSSPNIIQIADYLCTRDAAGGSLEVLRLVRAARRLDPGLGLLSH